MCKSASNDRLECQKHVKTQQTKIRRRSRVDLRQRKIPKREPWADALSGKNAAVRGLSFYTRLVWGIVKSRIIAVDGGSCLLIPGCAGLGDCEVEGNCCYMGAVFLEYQAGLGDCEVEGNCYCMEAVFCLRL